jgi:hypothetical protein
MLKLRAQAVHGLEDVILSAAPDVATRCRRKRSLWAGYAACDNPQGPIIKRRNLHQRLSENAQEQPERLWVATEEEAKPGLLSTVQRLRTP